MFENNILLFAQFLGFVSYGLGVLCFYQKNDKYLKIIMLIMNLNNTVHFYLLDAPTASLSSLFSVVRTGLSLKTSSKKAAYLFMGIILVSGIYLANHWYDMFPIIGACIGTYALFCLKGIRMRIAFLFGALCWLTNNIIVGSIGGTLLELTLIIVNGNTIRRLILLDRITAQNNKTGTSVT